METAVNAEQRLVNDVLVGRRERRLWPPLAHIWFLFVPSFLFVAHSFHIIAIAFHLLSHWFHIVTKVSSLSLHSTDMYGMLGE
jgi:hypothetical protein